MTLFRTLALVLAGLFVLGSGINSDALAKTHHKKHHHKGKHHKGKHHKGKKHHKTADAQPMAAPLEAPAAAPAPAPAAPAVGQ